MKKILSILIVSLFLIIPSQVIAKASKQGTLVYLDKVSFVVPAGRNLPVRWDAVAYDGNDAFNGNGNRIRLTVPEGVTRIKLSAQLFWVASDDMEWEASIKGTGGVIPGVATIIGSNSRKQLTTAVLEVSPGDYFEVYVRHLLPHINVLLAPHGNNWFAMEIIQRRN